MARSNSVKQVGAVESEGNPRCEEGFTCVLDDCPKAGKYVCRPRKFIEHIQKYHKVTMRWWCSECSKYFFKHTCWSKHCNTYHGQAEYVPKTYHLKAFDVKVDKCEVPYNAKAEEKLKKLKRKAETEQSDQPTKKKRRVVKAAKPSSLASDDTEKTIKSLLHDLITDMPSSENLEVINIPFTGITVNGEAFVGDENDNDNVECLTIEVMITELSADVIEVVEETKVSPKKQLIRKWQEECVEAVPLDGGDVRDAGFEMELSEKQLKLASVKQQLKLKFDSMALSLEVLTKQLEDSEAKNVKLEATNDALKTDLGTIELERECL